MKKKKSNLALVACIILICLSACKKEVDYRKQWTGTYKGVISEDYRFNYPTEQNHEYDTIYNTTLMIDYGESDNSIFLWFVDDRLRKCDVNVYIEPDGKFYFYDYLYSYTGQISNRAIVYYINRGSQTSSWTAHFIGKGE